MDVAKLKNTLEPYDILPLIDEGIFFKSINYTDVSFSGGYAYNWVFSKNWLLNISLSAGLAYKHSTGDFVKDALIFRDFSFSNINFDGVGRFGLVWNNSKWYFGSNAVVHSYNYRKAQFSTSNYFGNVNVYIGFNFGRKKGPCKTCTNNVNSFHKATSKYIPTQIIDYKCNTRKHKQNRQYQH